MKKLLSGAILIAVLSLLSGCNGGSSGYTIKGKVGADSGNVYLERYIDGKQVLDSAAVQGGAFQLEGSADEPYRATLYFDHEGTGYSRSLADRVTIYVENVKINITGADSVKNSVIKGSKINDDAARWKTVLEPLTARENEFYKWWAGLTPEERKSEEAVNRSYKTNGELSRERKELAGDFVRNNPASYFAMIAVFNTAAGGLSPDAGQAQKLFDGFNEQLRSSATGLKLQDKINVWKSISIGATAPDFTQNDADGNPVKLSDFRGKYVLLDFWASWCGPCRGENPHVVEAYHKFRDRGFTVLGVSLDGLPSQDSPRQQWLKAIEDDKLEWTNVSDLQGGNNAAAKLYDVTGIPFNFLIGPDGKIVDKNLRGPALEEALAKYLGN